MHLRLPQSRILRFALLLILAMGAALIPSIPSASAFSACLPSGEPNPFYYDALLKMAYVSYKIDDTGKAVFTNMGSCPVRMRLITTKLFRDGTEEFFSTSETAVIPFGTAYKFVVPTPNCSYRLSLIPYGKLRFINGLPLRHDRIVKGKGACETKYASKRFHGSAPLKIAALHKAAQQVGSVSISMVANVSEAKKGDQLCFTLTMQNTSSSPLFNLGILGTFDPRDINMYLASDGGTISSSRVRWTLDRLDPGAMRVMKLRGQVLQAQGNRKTTVTISLSSPDARSTASTTIILMSKLPQTGVENFFDPIEDVQSRLKTFPLITSSINSAHAITLTIITIIFLGISMFLRRFMSSN